jgi:hypothetical protein
VLPDLESACPGTIQELCDRAVLWQKRLENPSQIAIDAGYIGPEIWNADQDVFWPRFLKALERPIRRDSIVRLQDLAKGPSARSLRLGPWLLTRRGHGITWQRVKESPGSADVPVGKKNMCVSTPPSDFRGALKHE